MQKQHSSLIVCAACGGMFERVKNKFFTRQVYDRVLSAQTLHCAEMR